MTKDSRSLFAPIPSLRIENARTEQIPEALLVRLLQPLGDFQAALRAHAVNFAKSCLERSQRRPCPCTHSDLCGSQWREYVH